MALYQKTAHELSELLIKKEIKATEVTESVLQRIKEVEPRLNSYLTLNEEAALKTAREVDEQRAEGETTSALSRDPDCGQG